MARLEWLVLGIDPAPSKNTVVFDGREFKEWPAVTVRDTLHKRVRDETENGGHVLVLWDAPLCMDSGNFYSREVDRSAKSVVKAWIKDDVVSGKKNGKIKEKNAVGVADAAGCPHNILSMDVLGMPAGVREPGQQLQLLTDPLALEAGGAWVAEVHPAVAIGAWYQHYGLGKHHEPKKLPRYKQDNATAREVFKALLSDVDELHRLLPLTLPMDELLEEATDDRLDAFVAWALGMLLLNNQAVLWRGLAPKEGITRGYYVMPKDALESSISRM